MLNEAIDKCFPVTYTKSKMHFNYDKPCLADRIKNLISDRQKAYTLIIRHYGENYVTKLSKK